MRERILFQQYLKKLKLLNNYSCNTMFDVYIIYIYLNDVTLIDLSL